MKMLRGWGEEHSVKREQQRKSPEVEMYMHEEKRPRRLGSEQVRVVGMRPQRWQGF